MRLVGVELSRYFSRRAVVLLLVAAALLTALVAGTTIWNTRPVSGNDLADARAQVQQQLDSPEYKQDLAAARATPRASSGRRCRRGGLPHGLTPTPEGYLGRLDPVAGRRAEGRWHRRCRAHRVADGHGRRDLRRRRLVQRVDEQPDAVRAAPGPRLGGQGGRGDRRVRRDRARAARRLLAGLLAVAESRGIEHERCRAAVGVVDGGPRGARWPRWPDWAATPSRCCCGARWLRSPSCSSLWWSARWCSRCHRSTSRSWSPSNNAFAWLQDGVRVFDQNVGCAPGQSPCSPAYTVSLLHGGAYLAVLLLVTLAVSTLAFRRRDIA